MSTDTIACSACGRNNGTRRANCMYCGAALPFYEPTAGQLHALRPLEEWEKGLTVVLCPLRATPGEGQVTRLAEVAGADEATARAMLDSVAHLPILRVALDADANLATRLLAEVDVETRIVSDAALELDRFAHRVRSLHFDDEAIRLTTIWGEELAIAREAIICGVEGRLVSSRVDVLEQRGKSGEAFEMVDASQYHSEACVVDLYGPTLDLGFRIKGESFDYNCLGSRPALRLDVNFDRLSSAMSEYVGPRYDGSFRRLARLLDHAWPAAQRVDARGIGRRGDFKKYTQKSLHTDVLSQFNRYSRLKFVLGA